MRDQLWTASRAWVDRDRPDGLLWSGRAAADLERWTRRASPVGLGENETSFVRSTLRAARRTRRMRALICALAAVIALSGIQYRAVLRVRYAAELSQATITEAEVEQGRQALLHGDIAEAGKHLDEAYKRGDRSPGTRFMLERALGPRMLQEWSVSASRGRIWSASWLPNGQVVTTDDAAQIWRLAGQFARLFMATRSTMRDRCLEVIAWNPSGSELVTGSDTGDVSVWSIPGGERVRHLTDVGDPVDAVAWSADGTRIAAARAGSVLAWSGEATPTLISTGTYR